MMDHASLPILPQRAQINYSQQAEIIAHLIKRASLTLAARADQPKRHQYGAAYPRRGKTRSD